MSSGINIRDNRFSFSDLTANLKFVENLQIGYQPDKTNSGADSIAIGTDTGIINQGTFGIAIGYQAAQYNQRTSAIAIGVKTGQNSQGSNAIAIGEQAGQNQQKPFGIAMGINAGQNNQGTASIAMGTNAGFTNQGLNSIAMGTLSGYNNQGQYSIAIGENSGQINQGQYSIALGANAGKVNQGSYSIALGANAGQTNQPSNSIIINASGNFLNSSTSGLFLNPIRKGENNLMLVYKKSTLEIMNRTNNLIRVGDLKYSSRLTDDDKWFICDGRSLSVAQYPLLFAIIGYSFGGAGANFNLPDPRSRILGAIGQGSGLSNRTLGQNVGAETHTLSIPELPVHNHTINDPGHTHTYTTGQNINNAAIGATATYSNPLSTSTTSSSTTGITLDNTGGDQPHNIMQPTLFIGNLFVYVG